MNQIIKLIHCYLINVSVKATTELLKMSRSTVVEWNQRFRYLVGLDLNKKEIKLGGEGKILEIDESMYARVKHWRVKDFKYLKKNRQLWVKLNFLFKL